MKQKAYLMIKKIHILFTLLAMAINAFAQNTYTSTSLLSSGKWVKIRVKNEGVYQLSANDLKSMGFANPANVKLYGYNLPILPETNIQDIPDDLTEIPLYRNTPSGNLLFYSKGTTEWKRESSSSTVFVHKNNPYSSYVYYFLTDSGEGAPASFTKAEENASAKTKQTTYYAHALYEKDDYSFINCGRTFFESYDFANGSSKSYSIPLVNNISDNVSLALQFGAAGKSSSSLSVKADTVTLGRMSFSSLADYQYASVSSNTFSYKANAPKSVNITLQHSRTAGVTGHLDYIRASYEANLNIDSKYIAFSPKDNNTESFVISSSESDQVVVWKVNSPSETCEIPGKAEDGKYTASSSKAKWNDSFVALKKNASYPTPEVVGKVANQNLHALSGINLLIIVPSSGKLTEEAKRLAAEHEKADNMKCAVVTAEQVYNEFSSGTPDVTAYRRMAKMLYDRDNSLQNILLFGACFWDNRFVTSGLASKNPNDYLLIYESDNSWSHTDSYPCEEYISLLDDNEGVSPLKEKPDAGVGRIPVTTVNEAKQVVDKLITYIENREAGGWKNTICFMGDDGNDNIHMIDAEAVLSGTEARYPDYRYKRIYWDSYKRQQSSTGNSFPDALNEINRTMEEGALIMNYTGHGAAYCLSHEKVLKTENFANWTSPRLPLWLTAACDVCPFDMNTENLAVTALLNPKGAAMGFISTARTVYSSPNRTINNNFMKYVLGSNAEGEQYTIGEALALAKCDIIGNRTSMSKLDSINKAQYVLMGDPAIRLLTPKYKVKIDSFSGDTDDAGKPVIKAGSIVTIKGHVVDEKGNTANNYDGIIYPTVFDTEENIVCYNNDDTANEPFEFRDYRRTLYSGSEKIESGAFSFTFSVPLDINYENANGLIKLYAVNSDHTTEANGTFKDFVIGASNGEISNDSIGPSIAVWLNDKSFHNGMHVGTTPVLYATLTDSVGINTTGNGIGHNIVAIIDGKETTTYTLNNYFSQQVGDYKSGTITFQIPTLTEGEHTLTLRAFDTLNNLGSSTITFYAYEGEETVETFDATGRLFDSKFTTVLPPGIYIRRYTYKKDDKVIEVKTKKFIVK